MHKQLKAAQNDLLVLCKIISHLKDDILVLNGAFTFTGGDTRLRPDGRTALGLVDKPIIVGGKDVLWNGQRFRKLQRKKLNSSQLSIQEVRTFTPTCLEEPLQRSILLQYPPPNVPRQ